ncbi:MAG: RNA 2'-phosphotransferase [Methanobacteriota archaeon]
MLKECRTHGYFRAEDCPVCGDEGRFLMNEEELDRIGRTMAGVLRHFPERYGLTMDEQGWIDLEQFVTAVQARQRMFRWLKTHHIMAVIETDPKGRYQFREGKIRATYAHSIEVKLDLPTRDIPDVLYYPTTQEEMELLLETGLKPADRKMVHLSKTYEAAVVAGRVRVEDPAILAIDSKQAVADGMTIQKAGTTVFLISDVPAKYLSKAEESEVVEEPEPAQKPSQKD